MARHCELCPGFVLCTLRLVMYLLRNRSHAAWDATDLYMLSGPISCGRPCSLLARLGRLYRTLPSRDRVYIIGFIVAMLFSVVEGLRIVNDRCRSSMLATNSLVTRRILEAIADLDLVL